MHGMPIVVSRGERFAWSHAHGDFSDADFSAYCAALSSFLGDLRESGVVLSVTFDCPPPTARQRRELAAVIDHPRIHLVAAHAVVNDSAPLRGVLTAIRWILPKEYPEKTFASVDEAFAWMNMQLPKPVLDAMRRDYDARTVGLRTR